MLSNSNPGAPRSCTCAPHFFVFTKPFSLGLGLSLKSKEQLGCPSQVGRYSIRKSLFSYPGRGLSNPFFRIDIQRSSFKNIMAKTQTTDFFIACKESRIENKTSFYGSFYLGPFDDNLTQTLANDLRRTLLSELTGLSITCIEIEGVLHKFSNLPGMKESVLDLICNIQNIVLKKQYVFSSNNTRVENLASWPLGSLDTETKTTSTNLAANQLPLKTSFSAQASSQIKLHPTKKTFVGFLNVSGPRIIKASDLKLPAGLQCVDPNQYIATLAEDGFLNMKFNINEGKIFIKQQPYNLDVNTLKKRNILLQNFKKTNTLWPSTKVKTTYSGLKKSLNSVEDLKTQKTMPISNPIPLDAVFMPITKINSIIEENNLYSDFTTDPVNFSTNTFDTSNQLENKKRVRSLPVKLLSEGKNKLLKPSSYYNFSTFLNFIDYNLIYQTASFLPTWPAKQPNKFIASQLPTWPLVDQREDGPLDPEVGGLVKGPLRSDADPITQGQGSSAFYVDPRSNVLNAGKLIPWQSNSLYFDLNFDSQGFDKDIVTCNTLDKSNTFLSSSKAKGPGLSNTISFGNRSESKIKNFLSPKTFTLETQNQYPFTKAKAIFSFSALKPRLDENVNTVKTILQKKVLLNDWKVGLGHIRNQAKGLINENYLNLEYKNNLKLKPLRKKSHLIIEIWTNGSLHPRQALYHAFSFLCNNFLKLQTVKMLGAMFNSELAYGNLKYSVLNNYKNKPISPLPLLSGNQDKSVNEREVSFGIGYSKEYSKLKTRGSGYSNMSTLKQFPSLQSPRQVKQNYVDASINAPIGILNISLRSYTALKKAGILTIKDLINISKNDLLKIKNLGPKALFAIETNLLTLGLTLKN